MGDIQKAKRELLEAAVVRASLALLSYTGASGFSLPLLTAMRPQLYVVVGSEEAIKNWRGAGNDKPVADSNR